ncbi:MAG: hypothetical protein CVT80_12590 [Alphaproteobacteria bacterium HGW-Alphaproteobacteria-2]|nr:MAG: hypothetical protein CVT80_12590 [Alphaproteobacteria bacterium HGW-Alphaproteobacteria-2]
MTRTIGNPASWGAQALGGAAGGAATLLARLGGRRGAPLPEVRRLEPADIGEALRRGLDDFAALRSDVIFICLLYPVIGACLAWIAFRHEFLPLLFPLLSGFALVGPLAGVGLYEMSRRREAGGTAGWADAFAVMRSPAIAPIAALGVVLLGLFIAWIVAADWIHALTLGPEPPASLTAFLTDVFTTGPGWAMIVLGCSVGLLFAAAALAIGLVSFPLLLDRDVGLPTAVVTSVRVVMASPRTTAAWGLVVAAGLVLGTVPLLLGLIVVLPVLGHASWHLYRRAVLPLTED